MGDAAEEEMIKVTAKIEGGEELLRKLRAMSVDVDAELEAAVKDGGEVLRTAANDKAPGPHVEAEIKDSKKGRATIEIGPDKDHWYYRFFETGTAAHEVRPESKQALKLGDDIFAMVANPSGMSARPFMRPAFDEKSGEAEKTVGERLRKAVEK
jgi:HK97 gp10 family phage protein